MPKFIEYSLGKFIALYTNLPMKVGRRLTSINLTTFYCVTVSNSYCKRY